MVLIIKSRLILVTAKGAKIMAKTMSIFINQIKAAEKRLIRHVKPLNDRLNPFNMCVYWDGDYKEWFLNTSISLGQGGVSFWLDENKLKKLMDMSNADLMEYCDNWGKP